MSEKLEKLARDIEKAKEKRVAIDKKIRELEDKYREQENTEIHDMVREANLTPEKLAELIARLGGGALPQTKGGHLEDVEETEGMDDED